MPSPNFETIDRQLADLGKVPSADALAQLILRHAGASVTLHNVDALLDAIGHPVAMPPRLQPTMVDAPAPRPEEADDEPLLTVSNAPPSAAPSAEAEASAVLAALETETESEIVVEGSEASSASKASRARLPWESDPVEASEAAEEAARERVPPSPLPDLEALFSDDVQAPPPRISSVIPAKPPSLPPRRRHDTIEQMPSVSPRLAPMSALDLDDVHAPAAPKAPSEAEAMRSDDLPPLPVAAAAEEDEFEILVDDEILEIEEDGEAQ